MGGGIYAVISVLTLQATLLTDNVAPVGATLSLGVGTTAQYLLPAPPGHWVPATKCEIWREAEAEDPGCAMNHTQNVDACQEGGTGSAACPLATESQPCNWRKDPSLLGEVVYVLPLGAHDDALPTPCSIGLLGGNGSDARQQTSAKCAGLCPAGKFCAEEATVQPSLCPKGHYCRQGTATPLPCEAGTFGDAAGLSGADQCTPTSPGSYATAGSTEQTPCSPGTAAANASTRACDVCGLGTYQDAPGQLSCRVCPKGHYCRQGTATPLPCEAGTFGDAAGLSGADQCTPTSPGSYATAGSTEQTPCSPGTAAANASTRACDVCGPGTYQDAPGQLSCRVCGRGSYSANVLSCELCNVGEYCPAQSVVGTPCPVGSTTEGRGAEGPDECGCRTGTYDSAAAGAKRSCEPCNLNDVACSRTGLTLATVPLHPARWRHSNRTASIYECDSSGCPGGDWNGTSDGYCAPGREGPRCEWCSDPSRYYDALTATCEDCGDMTGYALRQMAILLAIAVALGLLRAVILRAPQLLVHTSHKLAQAAASMQQFGLQAKFKCCLSFYQVWAVRQSVYGFELPGSLSGVMAFFDALSFDVGTFIFPSWTCLGGLTARLVFSGLWPLVLMAVVALSLLALEAARKGGSFQRALLRSLEAAIFISFCVLPSVTRSLFLAFKCESFPYDDQLGERRKYLSASLNIECYSADHEPVYTTAWVFIVLWPVALPLVYGVLLFRCRSAILEHQPSTLSRAVRFLWFDYDDRCFWFEMVELGQKLVLTNFMLFVNFEESGSNKLLRLFLGLLIALSGLTVQLIAQPFRKRTDDAIASVVRLMLVLFFILGIMVKLCDTEGPNTVHNLLDAKIEASKFCFTLVGVATTEAVAWLIFCAGLLVVLVPLGMFTQKLAFSQSIPILRNAQTMEPPVLLLGSGKRYHLFLSHVWSTGQDQCAVIKRQLQLLLPGVVIFLDVDGESRPCSSPCRTQHPCSPASTPTSLETCDGRFAGHRRLGGLRARDGRDALLPVKAVFHLPQLPSRSQGDNQRAAAPGPRARAAGGEGRRATRDDADRVPRGDASVRL